MWRDKFKSVIIAIAIW